MFTQCRGCGEIFNIGVDELAMAKAMVRCNVCGTVFNALQTLSDQPPQEHQDLILHESDQAPPLLTRSLDFQEGQPVPVFALSASAHEPLFPDMEEDLKASAMDLDASAAHAEHPNRRTGSLLWLIASGLMLGLLSWQTTSAIRSGAIQLTDDGWAGRLCQQFNCPTEQPRVDLSSMTLVSRNIRPHPGRDNALIISASMINANPEQNKFPALEVILSDLNGQIVAMRRFLPDEYLQSEIEQAGFLANTLIPITLELHSPDQSAVAFEIDFVQP